MGLLLVSSASFAQAPPPPAVSVPGLPQLPPRDTAPKIGTARIRGRVVAADTGQPLRKAQVRATSAELRENRLATTDANGVYELTELPAGRYQLTATKGSFVQLQYGQTRPFEAGKPLQIGDGQTADKVDFNLPRGGLVTGRVVDEFGEGATDVQVSAMRYQFIQGRRQLMPAGRTVTTEQTSASTELFGLPPGQSYIGATLRAGNPFDGATNDRSGYAPTYYPSTANISGAERLTVELGQTRNGIDVVLATTRTARIIGTVVDADGKPLVNGMIMMMQLGAGITTSGGSQVRPDRELHDHERCARGIHAGGAQPTVDSRRGRTAGNDHGDGDGRRRGYRRTAARWRQADRRDGPGRDTAGREQRRHPSVGYSGADDPGPVRYGGGHGRSQTEQGERRLHV